MLLYTDKFCMLPIQLFNQQSQVCQVPPQTVQAVADQILKRPLFHVF